MINMPVVTVQLGQCGNQLGAAWFEAAARELSLETYGSQGEDVFFQQQDRRHKDVACVNGRTARAVLVDMEPKVIYSAQQSALASRHAWSYGTNTSFSGQSGSGNNWALGHNRFGPRMALDVLELVRRQVEACDVFEGFFMLQSMAGGTGAGAGTYLTEALVDEYSSGHMINCCVWPFEAGEVTVQPYNTLLSMSTLVEVSSGILLLQNEVLHSTCSKLLGIKQPGFKDLNAVAAQSLASTLLPCIPRPAQPTTSTPVRQSAPRRAAGAPHSNSSSSSHNTQDQPLDQPSSCLPLSPISDLTCHLFSHPSYSVASLRALPQVSARSLDFTSFSWRPLLARLKAMALAGVYLDQHLSSYLSADGATTLPHKYKNKANSSMLVLRGKEAGSIQAHELADAAWYPLWAVDPLLVAHHPAKLAGCPMSATLVATDKAGVAPLRAMQDRCYGMLASRAYLHQYEAYGLQRADFQQCFAVAEDVLAAYAAL